ncbi:Ras-related C3 botulinum toxin substrate 1 [Hondaea fermentalgiana]|uniref:non-specific serine/threonine protein kinase n=1 Tax=Hondaea fermentalgiana TaxID=2315210 RepID=A0A2R5GQA6_9STRA|nr:Ras-related C3 botulinum toxin substrate 1 [Hondaea fermentalgiana]|eukprot:GBG31958.1 Ras-related C3 botulinum toxin substrate 1 [Hondaea fermentalgiana]
MGFFSSVDSQVVKAIKSIKTGAKYIVYVAIGASGTKALAKALETNYTLRSLSLGATGLGDADIKLIAGSLQQNGSLHTLLLSDNPITDNALVDQIMAAAKRNKENPSMKIDARWLEAVNASILQGDEHAWGRAKLMIVGQGAAGKTSTVRSLLGLEPVATHESTEVADVHRTRAIDWQEIAGYDGEFDMQVRKAARRRLRPDKPRVKSLPRRALDALRRRTSRASTATSVLTLSDSEDAPDVTPLVPQDELAQRFALTEADQFVLRQAAGSDADALQFDLSFTIWDYGGQEVFYALHHIFLTDKGIYLVVFDMRELAALSSRPKALANLRFWLNSIKLHAPEAPILIVGTHFDKVHAGVFQAEGFIQEALPLAESYPQVVRSGPGRYIHAIDNMSASPDRAEALRTAIAGIAVTQDYVLQQVPLAWLKVHEDLLHMNEPYIFYDQVVEIATAYGRSRRDADAMLAYFNGLGVVVHLTSSETLSRVVVVDPQWLLDKLSRVIADDVHASRISASVELQEAGIVDAFQRLRQEAVATRSLLEFLWHGEEVDYLVAFMDANLLLCNWNFAPDAEEDEYLVSGLLSTSIPDVEVDDFEPGLSCILDFSVSSLPNGVFHRLVAQCIAYGSRPEVLGDAEPVAPKLDRTKALLAFGPNEFLIRADGDVLEVSISQNAERPAMVACVLQDMVSEQEETVFPNLPCTLLLVSPVTGAVVSYADVASAFMSGEDMDVVGRNGEEDSSASFAPFFAEDHADIPDYSIPDLCDGETTHVFLSYEPTLGGELAENLKLKLEDRGLTVLPAEGDDADAQLEAISHARAYILVLTKGVFALGAVKQQLKCALDANTRIVVVREADAGRASYAPTCDYIDTAPSFFRDQFAPSESLAMQRKQHREEAFYGELIRRSIG